MWAAVKLKGENGMSVRNSRKAGPLAIAWRALWRTPIRRVGRGGACPDGAAGSSKEMDQ